MIGRAFAVSLAVVLGVGLFGSTETFAKSGALPGGFSIKAGGLSVKGFSAKAGGLSARHGHSFARFPAHSVFLPPVVPAFSVGQASASPTRLLRPIGPTAPSYRRVFGYGLPAAGIGVYYGATSIPLDGLVESPPVAASSPDIRYAAFARRCTYEIKIVPSEAGGERSITIRRC